MKQQLLDLLYKKYDTLLLSRKQCAEATGISTATLDRLKELGLGPKYIKKKGKNGAVKYPLGAVINFIQFAQVETL